MLTTENPSVIDHYATLIDQKLITILNNFSQYSPSLYEAAKYSLSGGKKLRPILTLATAEMFGKPIEKALTAACALEMIHTYSLIHDDLPCMDDDDFRRGKPSLHKAFSEAVAVLTGDLLLNSAFEVIAGDSTISLKQRIDLICLIGKNAGIEGMITGQVMDIQAVDKKIPFDELQSIHRYKTGALLTASIIAGAIIGEATPQELEILTNFGKQIGLSFQIVDDILDVTESEKKHGKKISSDLTNNKTTYVTFLGLQRAKEEADKLLKDSLQELQKLPYNTILLQNLAKQLVIRTI